MSGVGCTRFGVVIRSSSFWRLRLKLSHVVWSSSGSYVGSLDISNVLSRALSCLRLSGHNFLVQRLRHNRKRRPYEIRICDKCDWHSVQDEEHILLDCLHEHLVSIRTQHRQLVFPPHYEDSPTRLRTFLNQPDIYGVASFVAECLALFPCFVLISFWFGFGAFSKLPLRCPPEAYIAV